MIEPEQEKNMSELFQFLLLALHFLASMAPLAIFRLVLVIGGGSPMNESYLLMMSLLPGTSSSTANWFLTQK